MAPNSPNSAHNRGPEVLNTVTGSGPQNNNNDGGAQFINSNFYGFNPLNSQQAGDTEKLEKEREACLQSLSFRNIDARQQDISYAHPETCDWFFETAQFQHWRYRTDLSNHNGVLWVKGNPGTGKSTLMKHTLGHCRHVFVEHIIVAHFFNARGESFEQTSLGMLRSLTYQLVEKENSIYERFVLLFREKWRKHGRQWEWRESELKQFLLSVIQYPKSQPVLVLVDALDECSELYVRDVVQFLEQLSVKAISTGTTLNICLSSRHYPHISMKKRLELVVEATKEHDEDIAVYVRDKLTKRDEEIEQGVLQKASGVFMWVVLVVAMLNNAYDQGKIEAMEQKLRDVPSDLENVFEELLSKDNPDKHETIIMLQCVLFTERLLRPEELYFAMIAGTNAEKLGAWDKSMVTLEDIRRRITYSSRGLIEVRTETETVQFIHGSVNDFLLRNQRFRKLDPALESNLIGTSHACLRSCCMSYIMMDVLPLPKSRAQAKTLILSFPFLDYASTYFLAHAEEAEVRGIRQAEFLLNLSQDDVFERLRMFHNAFEGSPGSRCTRGISNFYMLAAHGCSRLMERLLAMRPDVSMQGGFCGTAIQVAAYEGNNDIIKLLLEKGANVNTQGGFFGSALQAAAYKGEKDSVMTLLENGADVNAQGGFFGTALQASAAGGEDDIAKILLEKGADVNTQGGAFRTALHAAVISNKMAIVKTLLKKGADVNAQGGFFGTALYDAAADGVEGTVELLLENGANMNAKVKHFGSVFQAAASNPNGKMVWTLLEKEAEMNTQREVFGTALHPAIPEGDKVVQVLLGEKANANANSQESDIGTALQDAAYRGDGESVKLLLENGAAVNAQEEISWIALQTAAANSDEETFKMLLEQRTDVNIRKRVFGTELQAAAYRGDEYDVRTLLEKGADVNAQGGLFGTALQAAVKEGKKAIVEMLLEKGADVNAQAGFFGTALQAAAHQEDKESVELFIEKGADVNAQVGFYSTALQAASNQVTDNDIVKILLKEGADVNARGGVFETALEAAAHRGNWESVKILLEKGADVNAQGGLFGTALQAATREGNEEIIEMLLEKGADVNTQAGFFGTALQAAAYFGEQGIIAILLEKGAHVNSQDCEIERELKVRNHKLGISIGLPQLWLGIFLAFTAILLLKVF